jgi:hypothetical protein
MATQPVKPTLRLLSGVSCLHGHQLLYLHGMGNCSPKRVGGGARALCSCCAPWPTYQSELEGGRARRRLLVRGGDFSCEAETCCGDPSCGELVEDAAN